MATSDDMPQPRERAGGELHPIATGCEHREFPR